MNLEEVKMENEIHTLKKTNKIKTFKIDNFIFNFKGLIEPTSEISRFEEDQINTWIDNHKKEKNKNYYTKYKEPDLVSSLKEDFDIRNVKKISTKLKFCNFKLEEAKDTDHGVYIWFLDNIMIYIGKTKNLKDRFNRGYGRITLRNIFKGGQSTNCKMNRVVLKNEKSKGNNIEIYFCETKDNGEYLEKQLLEKYKTQYNEKH